MNPKPSTSPWPVVTTGYLPLPLLLARVHAGFPSPGEDHAEAGLDLTLRFVRRPACTYIVQVDGDSMTGEGIRHNDYVLVDRSRDPRDGDVVFAVIDGDRAIRQWRHDRRSIRLESAHPGYPPIPWHEGCEVWGVVTSVHRDLTTLR